MAGIAMREDRTGAELGDAALRAHYPLRPVQVSAEQTDPTLPAFFRHAPHAPHVVVAPPLPAAPSTHTGSTHADTSSLSSSSAAASTPPPAVDAHTRMQQDHAAQQHQQRIQQAPSHRQTMAQPSHTAPAPEKPASVDMQEQARMAQPQQQEPHTQAAREQQHHLAQHHAQVHRQAMEAQQRDYAQRHTQDTRPHPHTQPQAAEPMLYTPPTRPPGSDEHLTDFRHPDHPLHKRYILFKNALEQSHTLPRNGDTLPYGPAQQERLAAGFTDALGAEMRFNHDIRGFKQHQGQLLAYEQPPSFDQRARC
ncbi:hypothetical protein ACFOHQ_19460 [Xanthomonas fragariae]